MIDVKLKSVHPFPARMAPSIVWDKLPDNNPPLKILDPMSGSGTTLTVAKSKGHFAYGLDRDPLAVIISKAWCCNVNREMLQSKAEEILNRAKITIKSLHSDTAFPSGSDEETKNFIKYWFDLNNRKQLTCLSKHLSRVHDKNIKIFLWTAFSRMIITKKNGVSLAMDISHSRPHKVYLKAPVEPFDIFLKTVDKVVKANPFAGSNCNFPDVSITYGDSRNLPFEDNYFDYVITSPPYLNAIDYLRGHKLSLVWMRNSIQKLRMIRATNIGAEVKGCLPEEEHIIRAANASGAFDRLGSRQKGFLIKYIIDMNSVCHEIARVLKQGGKAIYVIGDSTIKGAFVSNSNAIRVLSEHHGLQLKYNEDRILSESRRYLPPPSNKNAGNQLTGRMRKEIILTMEKK